MKRIILTIICVFAINIVVTAQGVKFQEGTWQEILAKAKAEDKPIFVDVYTQWCGPCKYVSTNVFPQKELGDYYNTHFIAYKIDAESPAGVEFVKQYPVTAYPTFFFIDKAGEVLHKVVGAKNVDGFLKEAETVALYGRYGGLSKMLEAINSGNASKEMLFDYYRSADEKTKPWALNLYLKSLPTAELIAEDNQLLDEITLYDKELEQRLVSEIVKASNDGRFTTGQNTREFAFNVVFPVQYDLSCFMEQSIQEGNSEWLEELLQLKEDFSNYGGRDVEGGELLDGDLDIIEGRGLFFATPIYIHLCFWTTNRVNEEEFKKCLVDYMEDLMKNNPEGSLFSNDYKTFLTYVKQNGSRPEFESVIRQVCKVGCVTTLRIIEWADYFWKVSPSDDKTKELCSRWIDYAFRVNPYNTETAFAAADLFARIGNFSAAVLVMEKAIKCQKELGCKDLKLLRRLEFKLTDMKNCKI